jgi:hypothetical protein
MTQITPNQIRPAGSDGQVVATIGGVQQNTPLVPGPGISIAIVDGTIVISANAPFTISSFTGGETVELGAPVVNPAFAASYSSLPTSANITNTEGIGSPLALTTPFTSGTVAGTFTHFSPETTTFTLAAVQGASSPTATQAITWAPAVFGGVGTGGATASVTAAGTTAVLSTGDILARQQLGAEAVGTQFGPCSPSGQSLYLLLIGGSHTFTDAGTGFPIPFDAPTAVSFVNAHGATVAMFLYQSTNVLFGTYTPKVAS